MLTPMTEAMMPAAVYRGPGRLEVVELPTPTTTDGAAVVAVEHCGICGTHHHKVLDGWGTPGSVFGHEWSGRIVDPGTSALTAGALVVGGPSITCGTCDRCTGAGRACADPGRWRARAPSEGRSPGTCPSTRRASSPCHPGSTRVRGLRRAARWWRCTPSPSPISTGATALVYGAGPIGAAIVAILVDRGIEVAVVEPAERRAALAAALGAAVRSLDELVVADHPGEYVATAADVVFETSGVRAAVESGITQVTAGGTLMLVGTGIDYPRLDTNRVILNEIRVTGAFNYDEGGFAAALDLIGRGTLPSTSSSSARRSTCPACSTRCNVSEPAHCRER
ncbi:MAG: zinc-binding dehydrogenase [Acidimicrobiales bacterium]